MNQEEKYPSKNTKELLQAILKIKNVNEAAMFIRDLLTIREINDISSRFQQAKLLYQGKLSYEKIAKICRVSTTTVTRTSHWLHHGIGGYKIILNRLFPKKK